MITLPMSDHPVTTSRKALIAFAFLASVGSVQAQAVAPAADASAIEAKNKAIVQKAFESWRGGGNVFAELLAPDVVWTIHGSSSVAGTYRGVDDLVKRGAGPLTSRLTGPVVPAAPRIFADGDTVIVRFDGSATTTSGGSYRNQFVWIFRMKDGSAVEAEAFLDLVEYQRVVDNNKPREQ